MNQPRTSGTATVMFTDVEASTDLTTRLGDDAAASLLATHDRLVLEQVTAYGGHDVRSTGDGFLVVFDSARAAVACALAIQRALIEREHAIRVRIGLNAGEVIEDGGEPFGAAINLAARVMDRAGGGEILTTDTVRQLVGTMPEASFRDRGRVTLKGFDGRQRLYEVRPAHATAVPPPLPAAPRRSPRGRLLLGAAILVAAIAAAAVIWSGSGSPRAVAVPPNSVAVIDPDSGSVVDATRVDENPGPVSAGAGGVWVLNLDSATLSRLDVRTHRLLETKGFGGTPGGGGIPGNVAASPQEVWVHAGGCNGDKAGALLHIRDGENDVTGRDDVPLVGANRLHPTPAGANAGCGLVASGTSAWLAMNGGAEGIARVDYDPATGRSQLAWARPLQRVPVALATGYGSVWGTDSQQGIVRRIDPGTGRTVARINVGGSPVAIAVDGRGVWVANAGDNAVTRIDPRTNQAAQAVAVGRGPAAIATGAGSVWVALSDAGAVARIDPRSDRVTSTIAVGHRPQGIAVAGGVVWVTVRS